jgi:WD40 repeat protein
MRCALMLALVLVCGCKTLPPTSPQVLETLRTRPGSHLSGTVAGLGTPRVLNREDFVWDTRASPDSKSVAVSRLGMKSFHLSLFALDEPAKARADVVVNGLEFNVEALDWSPDNALVAAISRDHTVRLFDGVTGAQKGVWLADEALTAVAFHPKAPLLAVGSSKGLVTVLTWPELGFVAEQRGHTDQTTGLAWASTGELFSSSWDRSVSVWKVEDGSRSTRESRARYEKRAGVLVFRGVFDGKASASFAVDSRLPMVVVRSALAQAAGIDVLSLTESVSLPSPMGAQVSRLARGKSLAFKGLTVNNLDVAVCDACLPQDAQAALGQTVLDRVAIATDESTQEFVFTPRADATDVGATSSRTLVRARRFTFEGSVNDVSVDAEGAVLAVALSELKGERTREVYEREKRKEVEPERPWDCAARVDSQSGVVLEKLRGHRGVVSSAAISPDGQTVVSGGWDKKVVLHRAVAPHVEWFGWSIRRVRFSRDARLLTVAAWTPQNPLSDHQSDPAAVVYEVLYSEASVSP